jgi:hypothetical protein
MSTPDISKKVQWNKPVSTEDKLKTLDYLAKKYPEKRTMLMDIKKIYD